MWKRWSKWVTLALLVWLNLVAWSIRTLPKPYTGAITLRERQAQGATEYTTLAPDYFVGSTWFSYAVALFIGFGLPFILPRLMPWLWHRGKRLVQEKWGTPAGKKIATRLALLLVCNVVAWDVGSLPFEDSTVPSLYHRQLDDTTILYTYLLPGVLIYNLAMSYVLAVFIAFGLPFVLPPLAMWLWRQRRQFYRLQPALAAFQPAFNLQGKKRSVVLAGLALFVVFNILAWDWVSSNEKGMVPFVLSESSTGGGWYDRQALYSGIAPGILIHSPGISWLLSFFVGEILPFLLLPALFRRRPPPDLPQRPVAGAPR